MAAQFDCTPNFISFPWGISSPLWFHQDQNPPYRNQDGGGLNGVGLLGLSVLNCVTFDKLPYLSEPVLVSLNHPAQCLTVVGIDSVDVNVVNINNS